MSYTLYIYKVTQITGQTAWADILAFFLMRYFSLLRCISMYMMGNMPMVLNTMMQINHAKWLFLADFQMATIFHTASQMANTPVRISNQMGRVSKMPVKQQVFTVQDFLG